MKSSVRSWQAYEDAASALTRAGHEPARVLNTLLGNLDGMVYRRRVDEHWTMEFASEGCTRLTGYAAEDLLFNKRVSYESIMHKEDRERVRQEIYDALAVDGRFDCEYRIVHASGEIRWAWERGTGIYAANGWLLAIEGLVQDITTLKRSTEALREAERRYYSLFENALEGIYRTTPDGCFLDANPALARIYGFDSPAEMIGTLKDIGSRLYVNPNRRQEFINILQLQGSVSNFESQVYCKDGTTIWISENARAVFGEDGEVVCYEGTVEDISDHKRYQARIEHQAFYDNLTGLANRSLLTQRLQRSILAASREGTHLAVVFVDLDRLKPINDTLGHHVGDELLRTVASRLKASVRESDTVARLGGDEFVLLLKGYGDAEAIGGVLERMHANVCRPWTIPQGDFDISCSIGVAIYPNDGKSADALLKHADAAMYRAKENGRNNIQFFTSELRAQATERLELERKLRRAVESGEFELHYQPRIDIRSEAIVGAEALIRWQQGEQELAPSRFMSMAEETGLIVPIGSWVLETACAQNKAWQDAGLPPLVISVNVSERQFQHGNLVRTIADVLERTGLQAQYLELELAESALMRDADQLMTVLGELSELGVAVSLDDFGTGYSSLRYLKRCAVGRLKIDRSFVRNIGADGDDADIVRTIIALGHNLGLKVAAEGVETDQQLDFLRTHGCDEAQGHRFGHPLPPAQFAARYRRGAALGF